MEATVNEEANPRGKDFHWESKSNRKHGHGEAKSEGKSTVNEKADQTGNMVMEKANQKVKSSESKKVICGRIAFFNVQKGE